MKWLCVVILLVVNTSMAAKDPFVSSDAAIGLNCGNAITLEFQHIAVGELLLLLADCGKKNIVFNDTLSQSIAIHLQQVSWQQALDAILLAANLHVIEREHVLYIESNQHKATTNNALQTKIFSLHYADAKSIAELIKQSNSNSPAGKLTADTRTNRLWVTDDEQYLQKITQLVRQFDIPQRQVAIQAYLVSIDKNYLKELGIDFGTLANGASGENTQSLLSGRFQLRLARLTHSTDLAAQLALIEEHGYGQILASPHLLAANRQPALIESGEEIPYQETSLSGGTSVTFKKAVLGLKVTPIITSGNEILLKLKISQDKVSALTINGVPAIRTQEVSTEALVNNGQTVALGGVFTMTQEQVTKQIPGLGRIPILGHLFRHRQWQHGERELMIFITPRIIRN